MHASAFKSPGARRFSSSGVSEEVNLIFTAWQCQQAPFPVWNNAFVGNQLCYPHAG